MKILVTGSHFTPAQAVIEEFTKDHRTEIVYVGRKYTREGDKTSSVESQVLPDLGVKFIPLTSGRLQRSLTFYTIPSLLKVPIGFLQAFYILIKERPAVVLSFGGYIGVPVVIAAYLLSIPIIIHEQTLVSGLASTITSFFADKIAVSFPDNTLLKKDRTVLTGNPLRKELLNSEGSDVEKNVKDKEIVKIIHSAKKKRLPLVLITGGNQGSHIINQSVGEILDELLQTSYVIHQTGDSKYRDFEKLEKQKMNLKDSDKYLVKKWINSSDMGYIFQNIDLAITRAGANTLLELAYFKVPSLVIPIPYIYKDEQNKNAQYFKDKGLAKILPQNNLTGKNLLADIKEILGNLKIFKEKARNAHEVVIPDAAKRVALETLQLVNNKNS